MKTQAQMIYEVSVVDDLKPYGRRHARMWVRAKSENEAIAHVMTYDPLSKITDADAYLIADIWDGEPKKHEEVENDHTEIFT